MIDDFYKAETVKFESTHEIDGSVVDITSDTVTAIVKTSKDDTDANAVISNTANVTDQGASGIAEHTFSSTDTNIDWGRYFIQIKWVRSTGEIYYSEITKFKVMQKVYD